MHGAEETRRVYCNYLDARVHPIGWTLTDEGKEHNAAYRVNFDDNVRKEIAKKAAPKSAFQQDERHFVQKHKMDVGFAMDLRLISTLIQIGARCELLDPDSQVEFKSAIVSDILSPYYFHVKREVCCDVATTSQVRADIVSFFTDPFAGGYNKGGKAR